MRYLQFIFLILFFVEVWSVLPPRHGVSPHPNQPFISGAIHLHSNFSDGGGSPQDIAEAAGRAGLDFAVLTDHNTAKGRREGWEKRYGNTDLFIELEASTPAGHALFFSGHSKASELDDTHILGDGWHHLMGNPRSKDIFTIISHPSSPKKPWIQFELIPEGVEIISFSELAQHEAQEDWSQLLVTLGLYPLNNFLSALRFIQVIEKNLSIWDNFNSISKGKFAILAPDAHSRIPLAPGYQLNWPTYEKLLKLGSNIIPLNEPLPSDFQERKKWIYSAIQQGKSIVALTFVHPFAGNDWKVLCGDKKLSTGESHSIPDEGCTAQVSLPGNLPHHYELRLVRDGKLVETAKKIEDVGKWRLRTPGNYRLEVWLGIRSWLGLVHRNLTPYLFYNPVYLR